jgi:formamidopyrimidine-DNA glycosylase
MPELPEVETIAKDLDREIKGRTIKGLWTDWPKYFKLPKGEKLFKKHIIGKKITGVGRRGKNVLIHLSDGHLLLVHQKMSGHLLAGQWRKIGTKDRRKLSEPWAGQKWLPVAVKGPLLDPMNRFIRLIFFLDKGEMLALSDLRRFAKVICGPREKVFDLPDLKDLGPEPLEKGFTFAKFKNLFKDKNGRIKQVLMDQSFVVGIGNIYADETLWLAKIHPLRRLDSLSPAELKRIYVAMITTLRKAVKLRGSSIDDYRDGFGRRGGYDLVRYVYQREGKKCPRCGRKIKRMKIGGRSAHFCENCQKT